MVSSDEERKGSQTEEPPLAANGPRPHDEAPVELAEAAPDTQLAPHPGESPEAAVGETDGAPWPAPLEDVPNPILPTDPAQPEPQPTVQPPALPEGVSDSPGAANEDEATGRRVESLLAEAPDGHPDGALPARGEAAPAYDAPPELEDFSVHAEQEPAHAEAGPAPEPAAILSIIDPSFHQPAVTPGRPLRGRGMDRVGPIVAFDFDGTLTVRDSFTAFLKWREGSGRYHAEMAALAPAALKYLFDRDPGKLKTAAIRRFLAGLPRSVLNEEAMEFATVSAPMLFRPDALKAWRRYRQDGARLMIVTASPENIVAPFARGLGADMLIATQLLFDQEDRVQGGLLGDNCRGPEKAKRIRAVLGEDVVLAAAYGDTDGDWEMLEMAEQQFMRLFVGVPGKSPSAG